MHSLFGLFQRDGDPVQDCSWFPPEPQFLIEDGPCCLGRTWDACSRDSHAPGRAWTRTDRCIVLATGRVDNRRELADALGLPADHGAREASTELIREAYLRWGEDCSARFQGDWAFAAWHPATQQLVLARDAYGQSSIYYFINDHVCIFASSARGVLASGRVPQRMNEIFLAQILCSWSDPTGQQTSHVDLQCLPPAHHLTVTRNSVVKRRYWDMTNVTPLRLARREDYLPGYLHLFQQAVRDRLADPEGAVSSCVIGSTLSGGLDSGSVTAVAARLLAEQGRGLQAYTSVPVHATHPYVGSRFGDEWSLAAATAALLGNVEHHPVPGTRQTILQSIQAMLALRGEPMHAAGNFYWLRESMALAREHGCSVLLTGQMGNAGLSWAGLLRHQSLGYRFRHLGAWGLLRSLTLQAKERLRHGTPPALLALRSRRQLANGKWPGNTAIHPTFAKRIDLPGIWWQDPNHCHDGSSLALRLLILEPGTTRVGGLYRDLGEQFGLEIRDPTADVRLLQYCLSIPDEVFLHPGTGVDRWLIRQSMAGQLPDPVRLNRTRGRQAGDLVPRLRTCAPEVEAALVAISAGPAAEYLDVARMHTCWRRIQEEDTPVAFHLAVTVLTRGLMAGLFINQFHGHD